MVKKSRRKNNKSGKFVKFKTCIIFLCLLAAVILVKDQLIKTAIVNIGTEVLGAKVSIRQFKLRVLRQRVDIRSLEIENPSGFPDERFLRIPQITVKCNIWPIIKGKIHLPLVIIDLEELIVIKDKNNKLNVDALKVAQKPNEGGNDDNESKDKPGKVAFQIDVLKLNIERVIYKDYSMGGEPSIRVYELGLKDKTLTDINSVNELAMMVIVQAMGKTTIKNAGIYAAAAYMGVSVLPVAVIGVMVAKDHSSMELDMTYPEAFVLCRDFIASNGRLKKQHKKKGFLAAKIDGHDVKFKFEQRDAGNVKVITTARKFMIPKPEYAAGILYRLNKLIEKGY